MKPPIRWALKWDSVIVWHQTKPLLFKTRLEARQYADEHYGYIRERPDLRSPPHNWRMPRPVRVEVVLREVVS